MKKILGVLIASLVAASVWAAPREATTLTHVDTTFAATNNVVADVVAFPAKLVGYTLNSAEAATNALTITLTRINTLVDRSTTNAPTVTTWTNTYTLATINTTNAAGALDSGSISDSLYTVNGDSITYTNSVITDGILTLDWQY